MSNLAWPVIVLQGMSRSLSIQKKWADTYAKCVHQVADLYAYTACMHGQNFVPYP